MKKLIAIVAIACAAVYANAATVTWNMNAIQDPSGTGIGTAGWQAAFFLDDAAGSLYNTISGDTDFAALFSTADQPKNVVAAGSTVRAFGNNVGSFDKGETAYGFVIVLDSADVATAQNFYLSSVQNKTVSDAGTLAAMTWVGTNAAHGSWSAINVPEPTSALMLLIGMAGLALRRKQA